MAQHDYVIANASGATVRADINNMALAISSNNSGSSAPSTTYAYLWWIDTGNNLLKLRNSANNAWITMPFSVTANNTVDINGGAIDGTPIGASSASTGVFTSVTASLASTISVTDNSDNLTLTSTDTDANSGPNLRMYRNSGSPADSDAIGLIEFEGRNDNTQDVVYAAIDTRIVDASDGTEDGRIEIATILAGTAGLSRMLMDATETVFNDNSKDLDFRVESDNDASAFFVEGSSGSVGIGNTNPSDYSFDTGRNLVVGSSSTNGALQVLSATDGVGYLAFADGTTGAESFRGLIEYGHTSNVMVFRTDGAERMRIAPFGRTLIGTTTNNHATQLVVASSQNVADFTATGVLIFRLSSTETGGQSWNMRTAGTGSYGSGAGDFYFVNGSGTTFYYADASAGTVVGDFVDTSDVGLKENITNTTDGLTKLLQLQPRKFDWKDENKGNNINGFVAQEVETVLPNEVTGDNYDADNPFHGSKGINTSGILAVAVKAIQEQQTIIEDLKTRIETLEG